MSLLYRGRPHSNAHTCSLRPKILRIHSSKPKTQVAASSETSYPRILQNWYMLPYAPQISDSKISLSFVSNSFEQNPSGAAKPRQRIQRLLLDSVVPCLLHKSQPYSYTHSYYLSYSLTWPNITPASSIRFFPPFIFCGRILEIFLILCMCSTCFTHQSPSP